MKKGYFTNLKGNADEGYDFDSFFGLQYNRYCFKKAETVKIDGEIIKEKERPWILASFKPIEGKLDHSGEFPSKEQFIESELKKFREYPSPDPDNTFTYNVVPKYKKYLVEAKKKLSVKKPKEYGSVRRVLTIYLILKFDKNKINSLDKVKSKIEELLKLKIFPDPFNNEITLSMITSVHKQLNCRIKGYKYLQCTDLSPSEFKKVMTSGKNKKDFEYASKYLGSSPKSQMLFDTRINVKNLKKDQIILAYQYPDWHKARVQKITTHDVDLKGIEGILKGKPWREPHNRLEDPERYTLQE